MDVEAYLRRIDYTGGIEPNDSTLRRIHRAHMFSVPFENLDIHLGVKIELDLERIYKKIVTDGRGGFCYELNGLFGWLLTELGFDVELFSARVFADDGKPGPEFDHMLMIVNSKFIADVGFGDSFIEPLIFDKSVQVQGADEFRITQSARGLLLETKNSEKWVSKYLIRPEPAAFMDFAEMCEYQQTSSKSNFTQKIVCSMARSDGRVTYADGRIIQTKRAEKTEHKLENTDDLKSALASNFGFVLEGGYEKLLPLKGSVSV